MPRGSLVKAGVCCGGVSRGSLWAWKGLTTDPCRCSIVHRAVGATSMEPLGEAHKYIKASYLSRPVCPDCVPAVGWSKEWPQFRRVAKRFWLSCINLLSMDGPHTVHDVYPSTLPSLLCLLQSCCPPIPLPSTGKQPDRLLSFCVRQSLKGLHVFMSRRLFPPAS